MKDQELILRFIALAKNRDQYKRPMRRFLNKYLDERVDLDKKQEREFRELFNGTISFARKAIGEDAFRPEKQLNAAVFDSVMVGLAERLAQKGAPNLDKVRKAYSALFSDEAYIAAYHRSTSDEEQVRKRIDIAIRAFANT